MAKVTLHREDDPAIVAATKRAKQTFRYFWRELSWEYRRIVPGLDLAAFKAAFTDDENTAPEVMWVSDVQFDGYRLSGRLLNQPNWLTSIKEGDPVRVPLKGLVDWLYAIESKTYGGFTVHAIRKKMSSAERRQHDSAWGLDFGDPDRIHVVPAEWYSETKKPGFLKRLVRRPPEPLDERVLQTKEHPMAVNMADSLNDFFKKNPKLINELNEDGLNMFHHLVLSGNSPGVKIALQNGADINGKSKHGHTPLAFAKALGWKRIALMLYKHGAK